MDHLTEEDIYRIFWNYVWDVEEEAHDGDNPVVCKERETLIRGAHEVLNAVLAVIDGVELDFTEEVAQLRAEKGKEKE